MKKEDLFEKIYGSSLKESKFEDTAMFNYEEEQREAEMDAYFEEEKARKELEEQATEPGMFLLKRTSDWEGKNDKVIKVESMDDLKKISEENDNCRFVVTFYQEVESNGYKHVYPNTIEIYDDYRE